MAQDAPQEWSVPMDPLGPSFRGAIPVVALADAGLVLASTGTSLRALRFADGAPVWQVPAYTAIEGFTVQGDGVFATDGQLLRAFALGGGATRWEYEAQGMTVGYQSAPIATDRVVVAVETSTGTLHAVRRDNGREIWVRRYTDALSSGLATNGKSVFYSADAALKAVDLLSGEQRWTWVYRSTGKDVPNPAPPRNFVCALPPRFNTPEGSVVVTLQNNYSVNATTGQDDDGLRQAVYTEAVLLTSMVQSAEYDLVGWTNVAGHFFVLDRRGPCYAGYPGGMPG